MADRQTTRDDAAHPVVTAHYADAGLPARLAAALAAAGLDPDRLRLEDLEPIDEMHVRGRAASAELTTAAGITAADRVLDIGCGIGGPARRLSAATGCRVLGVDLTAAFCATARRLTRATGLADQVTFACADALRLPLADAAVPVVWTQHAAMNIADKPALYREIARVLPPGGRFALYDLMAGDRTAAAALPFPLPWASEPAASHLRPPADIRAMIEAAGFTIDHWREQPDAARAWLEAVRAAAPPADRPPPLGMHVLGGAAWPRRAANLRAALLAGAVLPVQAVARKRG